MNLLIYLVFGRDKNLIYRMSVGEVRGKTFVKLMEALVESELLYGEEVWGSCKLLDCIDQVQLRAYRIYSWGLAGYILRHLCELRWGCSL